MVVKARKSEQNFFMVKNELEENFVFVLVLSSLKLLSKTDELSKT